MGAFLLWLCKISLGGFSQPRRLSSPVSPGRKTHLAGGLSSMLSHTPLVFTCRVCAVFPSLSVSAGLRFPQRQLRLPLTLTAFGPVELFHVISGINEFLLLVVCPLSVG